MRWRTSVSSECWPERLRHSGTKEAISVQRPRAVSAWASQGKPPSEVRRPASKAACKGSGVGVRKVAPDVAELGIAGVSLVWVVVIPTPYQMAPVLHFDLHE